MYVETEFVLALIKEEDRLAQATERIYQQHRDQLWTSQFTLIELLLVAYREGIDAERVIGNASELLEIRGDTNSILRAAAYVEDHKFTPFDALHLVQSSGDTIVSSDTTYEGIAPYRNLRELNEE